MHTNAAGERLLSVAQVAEQIGYSVSHTWLKARTEPDFPKPVKAGLNHTRWKFSEVQDWITSRPRAHRSEAA